ncbi:50S ribosomal protein L11 methyltransferase [Desulfolutivibrio sulfoxidireducens]|uniref:50S ribosomal protein L11 methyltransferase n=1 Tax=Desulfolutivibrio sulfoxidireducens TaxID=2773299 RepID=UPI003F61A393
MLRLEIRLPGVPAAVGGLVEESLPESVDPLRERLTAWLAEHLPQGWEELDTPEGALFRVHLDDNPAGRELADALCADWPDLAVQRDHLEREDWGAAWKAFFTPIEVGGVFEVLPPWLVHERSADRKPIVIEPKMAFGTGHHPTTALCLELFGELFATGRIRPGMRFLDLGTGSGILGIGLCRLGLTGIGLDIDPQAVCCAAENVLANGVERAMRTAEGSLDSLSGGERYDVVVANILAQPLVAMAPHLAARVATGGVLILSGILAEQAEGVAEAYAKTGLERPEVRQSGEWAALVRA